MTVTTETKEFGAHNFVVMVTQDIKKYFPVMTDEEILSEFPSSKIHLDLFKVTNGLWSKLTIDKLFFQ